MVGVVIIVKVIPGWQLWYVGDAQWDGFVGIFALVIVFGSVGRWVMILVLSYASISAVIDVRLLGLV